MSDIDLCVEENRYKLEEIGNILNEPVFIAKDKSEQGTFETSEHTSIFSD